MRLGINQLADQLKRYKDDLQNTLDQSTSDLVQTMEQLEMQNVALDLGFDDIDGDSIVYELITPIAGGYTSEFNPGQNTGPKPYDDIEWAIGFDLINPIESSSGFAFNTNTGLMTFTPTQLGKFLFSIAVHEYRNNKKIGTVYYESMLFVYVYFYHQRWGSRTF